MTQQTWTWILNSKPAIQRLKTLEQVADFLEKESARYKDLADEVNHIYDTDVHFARSRGFTRKQAMAYQSQSDVLAGVRAMIQLSRQP